MSAKKSSKIGSSSSKTATKSELRNDVAVVLILVGVMVLIATGVYLIGFYRNPIHQVPVTSARNVTAIQDWMTVRYIARSFAVPEPLLLTTLHITQQQAIHQNLRALAKLQNTPVATLISQLQMAITRYKSAAP